MRTGFSRRSMAGGRRRGCEAWVGHVRGRPSMIPDGSAMVTIAPPEAAAGSPDAPGPRHPARPLAEGFEAGRHRLDGPSRDAGVAAGPAHQMRMDRSWLADASARPSG